MEPQPTRKPRLQFNGRYRDEAQMRAVEARAAAAGMGVSTYLLECALSDRPRAKRRPVYRAIREETFAQIENFGLHLNSLARAVNRGSGYDAAEIVDAITDMRRLVYADPAVSGLFVRARNGLAPADPYPLAAVQVEELARIGNNLNQIAIGALFARKDVADAVAAFAAEWSRALTIEADQLGQADEG